MQSKEPTYLELGSPALLSVCLRDHPIREVGSISYTQHDLTPRILILVGASTGGPQALATVFAELALLPYTACLVVQHMPAGFTGNLARRLDQFSKWCVKEAVDNEILQSGTVYIAPGGQHLQIKSAGGRTRLMVHRDQPVNGHQPSIDILFGSVARTWTGPVIGVLMTGMGKDGAKELKTIRSIGGYTIAEAEETCVVYGMPKAAVQIGAADSITPLPEIANAIQN